MTDKNSSPKYSFKSPRRQYFSLPFGLVSHLLETEFPHLLLKLQKSCKHFFAKKRVIVVDTLIYLDHSNGVYYIKELGSTDRFKILLDKRFQYWFTRILLRRNYSILRPYIYRLTLTELTMSCQNLSQNDIDFLFSNNKMEKLDFYEVTIRDDVGNPVPVDYILAKIPNVTEIFYWNPCEIYSNELLKKLNSIKFNYKLTEFRIVMQQTSEEIDAEILEEFIKRNLASDGCVSYYLPRNSPEIETVKTKLQQIVDGWVSTDGKKPRCYIRTLS